VYDGEDRRVVKVTQGGPTTTYVYDASGQLAAEYATGAPVETGPEIDFFTADHLGSTRLVTTNGSAIRCMDYLPFGQEIPSGFAGRTTSCFTGVNYPSTNPDKQSVKFTEKERDAETGLDFFGARYLSSAQGRFSSPDLISGWPSEPRSWNRYVYALNSPLRYVDPTGLASVDANGNWVGDFNNERDCSSSNGCLVWNGATNQWEAPSRTSMLDLPGQFFVGFGELALNNNPKELWRVPYAVGAELLGGAALSKGLQLGSTAWKLRNAKFAQTWAREAFSRGGKFGGQTVDEVAEALQTGALNPSDVPVEFVMQANGTATLLNTRSTVALTLGGVPQPMWKLVDSTADLAANIRLAGQLTNNAGAPTSTVLLVPSSRAITIGH
jgi:RHS repeat-associated protein